MQSIQNELNIFEEQFAGQLQDGEGPAHFLLQHIAGQQGGRLRPKTVMLAAGMQGGITPETIRMAVLVEMLHSASLVHDDIVDDAKKRRDKQTINDIFGGKVAVLLGDLLFSKVLEMVRASALPGVLDNVLDAVGRLTRGEICQLSQRNNLDMGEAEYKRIVMMKTASLFEVSFRLGAVSAGATPEEAEAYAGFGQRFGIFFQYKDDWKDFAVENNGKGCYNDLREGDVTLPVICAMQRLCMADRAEFRRRYLQVTKDEGTLAALAETVAHCGALEQVGSILQTMEEELLASCAQFPASPYREDLMDAIRKVGSVQTV